MCTGCRPNSIMQFVYLIAVGGLQLYCNLGRKYGVACVLFYCKSWCRCNIQQSLYSLEAAQRGRGDINNTIFTYITYCCWYFKDRFKVCGIFVLLDKFTYYMIKCSYFRTTGNTIYCLMLLINLILGPVHTLLLECTIAKSH